MEPSERWGHGVWFFKTEEQKANQEKILQEIFVDLGGEEGFKTKEDPSDKKDDDRPMFVTYISQVNEQYTNETSTELHMKQFATYTGSMDHHGSNRRSKKTRVPIVARSQQTRRIRLYQGYRNHEGQDIHRQWRQRGTRARYSSESRVGYICEKSGKIRYGIPARNTEVEGEGKGRRRFQGHFHSYIRNTYRNVLKVLTYELPDHLGNDKPRQQEASDKPGGESYGARDEEDVLRGSSGHEPSNGIKTHRMYVIRQGEGQIRKMFNLPGSDLSLYNSVKSPIIKKRFINLTRKPSLQPEVRDIREPKSDTQKNIKVIDLRITKDESLKAELTITLLKYY